MLHLVDPTGRARWARRNLPPRRRVRVRGARVGLVDSGKRNADRFAEALGELMRDRLGAAEVLVRRKPNPTLPAPADLLEELSQACDFVVHGVGD